MKLNSQLVERTLSQFDAQTLPESHPAIPQRTRMFGDHTFFLDDNGLHIVQPSEPERAGTVVKLASWSDAGKTTLTPHEPEPTDVVIELGAGDSEPAA